MNLSTNMKKRKRNTTIISPKNIEQQSGLIDHNSTIIWAHGVEFLHWKFNKHISKWIWQPYLSTLCTYLISACITYYIHFSTQPKLRFLKKHWEKKSKLDKMILNATEMKYKICEHYKTQTNLIARKNNN